MRLQYRVESEEQLTRSLRLIGALDTTLVNWLGHPLSEEWTSEEYRLLTEYLPTAEEAVHQGQKAPPLPERHPPTG